MKMVVSGVWSGRGRGVVGTWSGRGRGVVGAWLKPFIDLVLRNNISLRIEASIKEKW